MNLALHGFLLQVFVSILDFHHGRLLCSAGEPGYLDFDNLPETNFSCQGKVIGGYYADVEAGCQMFHVCTIGQKDEIMDIKFLCLNGTVFDQETRVCERVDEVDCSKSERFYNLNLELYGNNAVTLSLHENGDDEDDLTIDTIEDHQPRTTARPSTSTTTTTTSRSSKPSTTAASGSFQHPSGYPQHYQPQPPFPQVHTSQSKSLYDDKNGGYHHQYIFHNGGERTNNQATSYQLFSNQGAVSSTTVPPTPPPPPPPQIHQIRYSSTVGPPPQIIHSEPSTVTPLFHATSSTIQTLLNSNANNPVALINPIFHNHGIASTTEQFTVHSNNPRETGDYRDDGDLEDIRTLEAIQSANKGKISKLAISPVPTQQEPSRIVQTKTSRTSQQQQQRISGNFLPTPATVETTVKSFYPTPRPSPKPQQSSQSVTQQVSQHIHISPGVAVPQLKPHQITISLPPSDIQRIVQNPSPLLPSQSRVIVTAKASVSDESGRPLNTTQLVTLPLPTIPASYDDYKEGDESFDPFYRDVPKIRKNRLDARERISISRSKRSLEQPYHFIYGVDSRQDEDFKVIRKSEPCRNEENAMNKESTRARANEDFWALRESLIKFRDILFSREVSDDSSGNDAGKIKNNTERVKIDNETFDTTTVKRAEDNTIKKVDLEDLKTEASKHLDLNRNTNKNEEEEDEETSYEDSRIKVSNKSLNKEKRIKNTTELEIEIYTESTTARSRKNESRGDVIDLIILDSDKDFKEKATSARTDAPIEIIIEEGTKSDTHNASKTNEKVAYREQTAGYLVKDESGKRSNSILGEGRQSTTPRETAKRKDAEDSGERKPDSRRKTTRLRSSRRRISSRIRQQKTEHIDVTEILQKKDMDKTTTIATTSIPSTTTPTTTTTTVTPSVASFKTEIVEQIDSNIFGQLESKTYKELGTRAIDQRDATYSKSLQDDKSHDVNKNKEIERSFDHQIVKVHAKSSELRADKTKEAKQETESIYTQNTDKEDTIFTENPRSAEEVIEVTHISEEKKKESPPSTEEIPYKEYEFPDDDDINMSTETEESSQDDLSKIYSDEIATSRESNLEQEESSFQDTNEKSSTNVSDEEQSSTAGYSEEVNSEELNEYQDVTESSAENTRSIQEDYRELESTESSTALADYTNSEEYIDSQEDVAASTEEAEDSTEGVLKFTDELPLSDDDNVEATEEVSASNESGAHDYVDDNYEPENYKTEIATKSDESEEEKNEEENDEEKDIPEKNFDRKNIKTHQTDDSNEAETQTEYKGIAEVEAVQKIADLTTTSSATTATLTTTMPTTTASTTTASTTTASTTIASTTTASTTTASTTTASTTTASIATMTSPALITMASTTTASSTTPSSTTMASSTTIKTTKTTTRRPTTTTRATPPKLFKPTGNRRIYAYIPPTTTPIPVVIKSRLGLYNPKPAKPIRTYNELAPKPMIRKIILPRKPVTTTEAITIIDTTTTEKLNTENPEMTTEPAIMTTATAATTTIATTMTPITEATTTVVATTAAATTAAVTTEATTTTVAVTTEATTTTAATTTAATTTPAATTTTATMTTTMTAESGRSEENGLESKLEANEHTSFDPSTKNDQTAKEDQLPSPSEQNNPVNSSNVDPEITITKVEAFTPYPLSTLSTLASTIEQTTKEIDTKPQETTEGTDILTTLPPTTLLSENFKNDEIISSTEKYLKITETTIATTSKIYQQETSSVSSVPPIPERATSVSILTTVLPKVEDADSVASMEAAVFESNERKPTKPRKHTSFNCLERVMYRFYGDSRDCRLFHYCSPGFTSRQVLDFRFVCEEGTAFDEVTQSCRHDVRNRKCRNRG